MISALGKEIAFGGEEGLVGWHDQVGKGKVQAIRNNGMVQNSGAISDTTKPNLI